MTRIQPIDIFNMPDAEQVFVEASAGTGKTRLLCDIFVKEICLQSLTVDQILLVSFTKASTADLKIKITKRMEEVIDQLRNPNKQQEPFVQQLIAHLNTASHLNLEHETTVQDTILSRLREASLQIDKLNVKTVHGFCQSIISSQPEAFGMQRGEITVIPDSSLRDSFDKEFWRNLKHFLDMDAASDIASFIYSESDLSHNIISEEIISEPEIFSERWNHKVENLRDQAKQAWLVFRRECETPPKSGILNSIDMIKSQVSSRSVNILAQLDNLTDFVEGKNASVKSWNRLLDSKTFMKQLDNHHEILSEYLNVILMRYADLQESLTQVLQAIYHEAYVNKILTFAQENNAVNYDGLLFVTFAVLTDSQRCQQVQNSIGGQIKLLLVDEFQDLQPIQTYILEKIFEACPQIYVYDPKQSIYSFQGADHAHLLEKRDELLAQGRVFGLQRSWRFSKNNQKDINTLFARVDFSAAPIDPDELSDSVNYQHIACASEDKFKLEIVEGEKIIECSGIEAEETKLGSPFLDCWAFTLRLIKAIERGQLKYSIDDAEQNFKQSDIAILVRTNNNVQQTANFLRAFNITPIIRSNQTIWTTDEILLLVNVLGLIINKNSSLIAWGQNTQIFQEIFRQKDLMTSQAKESRLLEWLEEQYALWAKAGIARVIYNCLPVVLGQTMPDKKIDVYTTINQLLSVIPKRKAGTGNDCYMQEEWQWLNEKLDEYSFQDFNSSVQENDKKKEQNTFDGPNIMTVHQAKGLEFPVVIVVGDKVHRATSGDDDAEQKRLAYIALTRAKCYTYLCLSASEDIYSPLLPDFSSSSKLDSHLHRLPAQTGAEQTQTKVKQPEIEQKLPAFNSKRIWANSWAKYSYSSLKMLKSASEKHLYSEDPKPSLPDQMDEFDEFDSLDAVNPESKSESTAESAHSQEQQAHDIFGLPRGKVVGTMIHNILEKSIAILKTDANRSVNSHADGLQSGRLSELATQIVKTELRKSHLSEVWIDATLACVLRTLQTKLTLQNKISILNCDYKYLCSEANFSIKLPEQWAVKVADHLGFSPADVKVLTREANFIGYIDLLIGDYENNEFFVYDFKSDWLGDSIEDYSQENLQAAIVQRGYATQVHLYSVATARALAAQGITQATIHTGVIFLRGLAADGQATSGIWHRESSQAELLKSL